MRTRGWEIGPLVIWLAFEPRDLWLGVYWKRDTEGSGWQEHLTFYVCLLPMLPLVIDYTWMPWLKEAKRDGTNK